MLAHVWRMTSSGRYLSLASEPYELSRWNHDCLEWKCVHAYMDGYVGRYRRRPSASANVHRDARDVYAVAVMKLVIDRRRQGIAGIGADIGVDRQNQLTISGATLCFYWRPQGDSNPRTYRERVVS